MITIERVTPEQMLAAHSRVRGTLPDAAAAPVPPANVRAARGLAAPEALDFRGRVYEVRPIPFGAGLDLLELAGRVEAAAAETRGDGAGAMVAYRAALEDVVRLCWDLLRPGWCPRWLWRVRPNPFRSASLEELRGVLGFFGRCQTRSRDWHRRATDRSPPPTSST